MRDIFVERARSAFVDLFSHFVSSLADHFPDCTVVTREWKLESTSSTADVDVEIKRWIAACEAPLVKGCAKYAKAVTSILGRPASVSHAIAYHDIDAVAASSTYFAHLRSKLTKLSHADAVVFWHYIDELTCAAYLSNRLERPRVPTTTEISSDIAKRKGKLLLPSAHLCSNSVDPGNGRSWHTKSTHASHARAAESSSCDGGGGEGGMHRVVVDTWRRLHTLRGVECGGSDDDTLTHRLCELASEVVAGGHTVLELAQLRDVACLERVCATFPSLDSSIPLSEEQWTLLTYTLSMSNMYNSIPAPMMKGIESVAMEVANEIYGGNTTLESLDVASVAHRVLGALSADDIEAFKNKIPDIVPNLLPILRSKM